MIYCGTFLVMALRKLCIFYRIPEKKNDSPEFVHKTKTVRGKQRIQIEGWACKDCQNVCSEYIFCADFKLKS